MYVRVCVCVCGRTERASARPLPAAAQQGQAPTGRCVASRAASGCCRVTAANERLLCVDFGCGRVDGGEGKGCVLKRRCTCPCMQDVQSPSPLPPISTTTPALSMRSARPSHSHPPTPGWVLFMAFCGVGLVSLPTVCIQAYRAHLCSTIPRSEYVAWLGVTGGHRAAGERAQGKAYPSSH